MLQQLRNAVSGRRAWVAVGLFAFATVASAQRAGENQAAEEEQETVKAPTMREAVYQRLSTAQGCVEMEDWACAERELERLQQIRDLNDYERAQMYTFYAFLYFSQDNSPEAIKAYERVLELQDIPVGIRTDAMWSLAQLYVQDERYRDGLAMIDQWFELAQNPGPAPYVLKAQVHYQLEEFREGIPAIETAIELNEAQGRPPEEGWYQLLNVFYFELENYPKVIETLDVLINNWPKKQYVIQLAGIYAQEGQELRSVGLYEAAYEMGWLERSQEIVSLAQMLLNADTPVKAAQLLEQGLEDGTVESTESNWRLLSQAWVLAQEDRKAIPALRRAGQLANDGTLDLRLAQSHAQLAEWEDCATAARRALDRGGLDRRDLANMLLGNCLAEMNNYDGARAAFRAAAEDERTRAQARQWIQFIDDEVERLRTIEEMRQQIAQQR